MHTIIKINNIEKHEIKIVVTVQAIKIVAHWKTRHSITRISVI